MGSPFYTRGGDEGYTGFLGKGRVPKEDPRIEALGAVDEASSVLGVARAHARSPEAPGLLLQVQRDLYDLMAELAAPPENADRVHIIDAQQVAWLEAQVDAIAAQVEIPKEFIVPGDTVEGAFLDLARVVVRRAERRVAALLHGGEISNPDLLRYLNRLSSLCYILELREHAVQLKTGGAQISLVKAKKEK